ncbi:MAG: hypothetical protein DMG02_01345, partial [Acidobacteria bacterium]
MTIRVHRLTDARRLAYATLTLVGALALLWLDSLGNPLRAHHTIPIQQADVFTAVWAALQAIAGFLGTAAAATAAYLAEAVSWLAAHVAGILRSTGAMFSRVWDATKIVWKDVLKPALTWIDDRLKQLHDWLTKTFAPVFKWLRTVRDEIQGFYRRFVKPIVDTIEFLRAINRVLLTFHLHLLQKLDQVLAQIEQRIDEPFLWVNRKLTEIWNVLDDIVTLDGYFRRRTLVLSLARYAPDWMNGFWNAQIDPNRQAGDDYSRGRDYPSDDAISNGLELGR